MRTKICGIQSISDFLVLERYGIDFAGLWWQVPGGQHNLSEAKLHAIVSAATGPTRPMLVTLGAPVDRLIEVLQVTNIRAVQLHGFELPGAVRRLKAAVSNSIIFKVLHVKDGKCLENQWIDTYRAAGVDVFIIDTFVSAHALGSTGRPTEMVSVEALLALAGSTPVMLAGGVDAKRIESLAPGCGLWGVDIDSAARVGGKIDVDRVAGIKHAALRYELKQDKRADLEVAA